MIITETPIKMPELGLRSVFKMTSSERILETKSVENFLKLEQKG